MENTALTPSDDIEIIKLVNSVSMILKILRRSTGLRVGFISSTRDSKMTVCAISDDGDFGYEVGTEADLAATYCGIIQRTKKPLIINDASADAELADSAAYQRSGVKSYIGVPIFSEDGEVFGTVCAFDKITADLTGDNLEIFDLCSQLISFEIADERKNAKREQEFQKISASNEVRAKFMSILGHDLKNLLNAITMAARLQQMQSGEGSQISDLSEKILRSAKTTQEMISDLLDVTRIEDGKLPISRRLTNISHSINYCVEESRLSFPDVILETMIADNCEAEVDESRLCQLTANLLSNARRCGDLQKPIRIVLMDAGREFILQVQNYGKPIPPEDTENLFRPYWHGEKERLSHSQGLGLGLYIVSQIVKSHGGTISVTSNAENGTAFTITLPKYA